MPKNKNKKRMRNNQHRPQRTRNPTMNQAIVQVYGRPKKTLMAPLAPYQNTKFKYASLFDTSLVAGAISDQVFRSNSLFDPDRTNAGHQPLGFDQIAALYNRYHVYGLSWHIDFATAADAYHLRAGVVNGSFVYSTANNFLEFTESPLIQDAVASNGGQSTYFKRRTQFVDKFYGDDHVAYFTGERFGSTVVTNPSEIIDLHILLYNPTANTCLVHWSVTLTYYAIVHDPILPTLSFRRERDILLRVLWETRRSGPLSLEEGILALQDPASWLASKN
jgi:hypothetical protein